MAKYTFLLIIAATVIAAKTNLSRGSVESRQIEAASDALGQSLARQAALSGLAVVEHYVQSAVANGETSIDTTMGEVEIDGSKFGWYDAVIGSTDTTITFDVTGYYGNADQKFSFSGYYQQSIDMPGVLMVYTNDAQPEVKVAATLTGSVTRPPSIPAAGWSPSAGSSIAGLAVPPHIEPEYWDELDAAEWARISGNPQVSNPPPPYWMRNVVAEIEAHPSATVIDEYKIENSDVIGSPENPVILIITDYMFINDDAKGYGVIFVKDADLYMNNRGSWEGLIIMEESGTSNNIQLDMEDDTSIYGAVLMYGVQSPASRWTSEWRYGDAEVELWDASQLYWAPDVIKRLSTELPSLQGGLKVSRTLTGEY